MPELSIIVPCFNEADSLQPLLAELNNICVEQALDVEVIVSDDASEDLTLEVAQSLQRKYPDLRLRVLHRYPPRRGYGAIVRYGLAHATGRFAVVVAADGGNPVELLPQMLTHVRKGVHLVQCSRYTTPADAKAVPAAFRMYQSVYRLIVRLLVGRSLPDSTYGFKMFDRVLALALGATSNRFNLCPEITFKILLAGGQVVFIPGNRRPRQTGTGKFRLFREFDGFLYVALRAGLHRAGLLWF
jgi:glycosyltransferase involved in cell wall biosynthesis